MQDNVISASKHVEQLEKDIESQINSIQFDLLGNNPILHAKILHLLEYFPFLFKVIKDNSVATALMRSHTELLLKENQRLNSLQSELDEVKAERDDLKILVESLSDIFTGMSKQN